MTVIDHTSSHVAGSAGVLHTADSSRLALEIANGIPVVQQLREFVHNGLQACHQSDGGSVFLTNVVVDGVRKAAVFDTGTGMTPTELYLRVGALGSSASIVGDARFGVGSKVVGAKYNRCGLLYVTWTGDSFAARATFGLRPDGELGFFTDQPELVSPAQMADMLPHQVAPALRKAGHGTLVVLLGNDPGEDTFDTLMRAGATMSGRDVDADKLAKAGNRWFQSRYASLPPHLHMHTWAGRNADEKWEYRSSDNRGLCAALDAVAALDETVTLSDGTVIRCVWSDTSSTKASSYRQNDNAVLRNVVAVLHADAEVPGLAEIYEFRTGKSAQATLAGFGLGLLWKNLALTITPARARPNIQRTSLHIDDQPLPFAAWQEEFRSAIPQTLQDKIVEAASSTVRAESSERLAKLFADCPSLLRVQRNAVSRKSVTGPGDDQGVASDANGAADAFNARSAGSNGDSERSNEGLALGDKKSRRQRRALADGAAAPGRNGVAGPKIPDVQRIFGADVELLGIVGCAGHYDLTNDRLSVNCDFVGIDQLMDVLLENRKGLTGVERTVARETAIESITIQMLEAIVRVKQFADSNIGSWKRDLEFATTPQALTMPALTFINSRGAIAKQLAHKLGASS